MAWIPSPQSLGRDPKMLRLASRMRVGAPQVIGHLHYLWWWALDYAPDGNLAQFAPEEVAAAAEWTGDPNLWSAALHETGWIDPDGRLHGWEEGGGRLHRQREQGRERQQRWRDRQKGRSDMDRRVTRHVTPPVRVMSRPGDAQREHHRREEEIQCRESVKSHAATSESGPSGPPQGFPRTEPEAELSGQAAGAPSGFAAKLWHLAASRGWRDSRGVPLRNWASYLAVSLVFAREAGAGQPRAARPERNPERRQLEEVIHAPRL